MQIVVKGENTRKVREGGVMQHGKCVTSDGNGSKDGEKRKK